ncbi:MAG TPA: biotin--[acetyl-CoA-carboxylase] ligase [Armatimonadota bacterium]|jgi:BirA family biotin operon repressor/biotin-[acetyl-CoA-carboxylase] ligase
MKNPDKLDLEKVRAGLKAVYLGTTIRVHQEVDSTQEEMRRRLSRRRAGAVIVAESQTAGRGRRGRPWFDRPGQDLLFSVLLPPLPRVTGLLPVTLGAYLSEALEAESGARVLAQWPNDLVVGPAKLGGILVEKVGEVCLVGIGLNVKGRADEVAQRAGRAVTTLEAEAGRKLSRETVLAGALNVLDRAYAQLLSDDRVPLVHKLEERDALRGKLVQVSGPQGVLEGRAVGLTADGALLVRTGAAITEVIAADEVKVLDS